jgi:hypothetical protein
VSYTLLRVTEAGVVLLDYHLRRLQLGTDAAARAKFLQFASKASPGVWAVWSTSSGEIRVEPRGASRLRDGMPVRFLPSPIADRHGTVEKAPSPSPYDAVRQEGVATLLTSPDGREVWEACSAAVVAWDGESIVCPPEDRPRVGSTSETALSEHLPVRRAPIAASSRALLLVNAVKGTCALAAPHSEDFPTGVRRDIEKLFASSA